MNFNNDIAINENGFLFNPVTGDIFVLNAIAQEIVSMLHKGISQQIIIENIQHRYNVDKETIIHDYNSFLTMLGLYGIIKH